MASSVLPAESNLLASVSLGAAFGLGTPGAGGELGVDEASSCAPGVSVGAAGGGASSSSSSSVAAAGGGVGVLGVSAGAALAAGTGGGAVATVLAPGTGFAAAAALAP